MSLTAAMISIKKSTLAIILKSLLIVSILLANTITSYAASLTSTVHRNEISLNETLQLTVSIDQQVDSSTLQVNQLKEDFDILSISPHSSNSVSIINGKTTQNVSTQWTILLAPKRTGIINIPAFTINNVSSQAITIKITDQKSSNHATNKPLTVKATTSSDAIYPEQQLLLTITISAQSNVSDLNGSQLTLENADVELINQQNFQRIENGIARQFVELNYVIFPKKAGEIRIPPLVFTGLKNARRSFFNTHGDQVIGRSAELLITVKNKPDNTTPWFPAENVSLHSEWSGDLSTLQVGTPITRNIIITAKGQRASVIPPLNSGQQHNTHYKTYKDQAKLDTQKMANGLVATRIESEAIVPSSDGQITLPEVTLRWWNVQTETWQNAILPAETLSVSAEATAIQNKKASVDNEAIAQLTSEKAKATREDLSNTSDAKKLSLWQFIAGLLFCLCIILTVLLMRSKKLVIQESSMHAQRDDSESKQWKKLQTSLKQADASDIRQNIINWAKSALPNETLITLHSLEKKLGSMELKIALMELEEHLFKGSTSLDIKKLNSALNAARQTIKIKSKKVPHNSTLKPLYANQKSGY